jgi:hypothetical protein
VAERDEDEFVVRDFFLKSNMGIDCCIPLVGWVVRQYLATCPWGIGPEDACFVSVSSPESGYKLVVVVVHGLGLSRAWWCMVSKWCDGGAWIIIIPNGLRAWCCETSRVV